MTHVFERSGRGVIPSAFAAGPFRNVHGGAMAGALAAAAIGVVPSDFVPVSQRTEYLHSTPLESFDVATRVVRQGRSSIVVDVEARSDTREGPTARASVTFYSPNEVAALSASQAEAWGGQTAPESLSVVPMLPSMTGQTEWMMNATDVRMDPGAGVAWFRFKMPMIANAIDHWFVRMQGPIDWVGGFIRPNFPAPSEVSVWPNTDLTVHIRRPLEGQWIGIRPRGEYEQSGFGVGRSEVLDEAGVVGHVLLSVLAPTG